MADLFENPMGLDGFEFVEFTAPQEGVLEPIFEVMGFSKVAVHRSKDVALWRQGDISFITNYESNSHADYYAREHGPSACGMAFRVRDARAAYARALECGAELWIPLLQGTGDGVADGARLAGNATPVHRHTQIELARAVHGFEGLLQQLAQLGAREVVIDRALVDQDLAVARREDHPRNRGLAATCRRETDLAGLRHVPISRRSGFCAACGCSARA